MTTGPALGALIDRTFAGHPGVLHGVAFLVPPVAQASEAELSTPFPFKAAAVRAGLGWIGRNDLLVTPEYGPRVRLSAVLVDGDLPVAQPVTESRCPARCRLCVDACPHRVLRGGTWEPGVERDGLIDYRTCNERRSRSIPRLGRKGACGLCLVIPAPDSILP